MPHGRKLCFGEYVEGFREGEGFPENANSTHEGMQVRQCIWGATKRQVGRSRVGIELASVGKYC